MKNWSHTEDSVTFERQLSKIKFYFPESLVFLNDHIGNTMAKGGYLERLNGQIEMN